MRSATASGRGSLRGLAVLFLVGASAVAGCGMNEPTNPYPLLPVEASDAGVSDAARGSAAATPTTRMTSGASDAGQRAAVDASLSRALPVATFTDVYTKVLLVSCGGAACHNPGSWGGVNFFTQMNAYNSVRGFAVPGDVAASQLYDLLVSGRMPPGGVPLSAPALAIVASWIEAGALAN